MPRIPTEFLECVFYLYKSVDDANAVDNKAGGSGFFVAVNDSCPYGTADDGTPVTRLVRHIYAVTNDHNISNGYPVIRLNAHGKHAPLPLTADKWVRHPSGDDLSISLVSPGDRFQWRAVDESMIVGIKGFSNRDLGIGYGDDVFMVGRFVTHQGIQRNTPMMRFGNVAMTTIEPVEQWERSDFQQDSILIDMRGVPGFSGSPVFAYKQSINIDHIAKPPWPLDRIHFSIHKEDIQLLGVEWGALFVPSNHQSGLRMTQNEHPSGISGVVPAWKLRDLLYNKEVGKSRREASMQYIKEADSQSVTLL